MKPRSTAPQKLLMIGQTLLVYVLTIVTFFSIFGWLRLVMVMTLFPIFQFVALLIVNLKAVKYFKYSRAMRLFNLFFNLAIPLAYLFMPDVGDAEPIMAMFYGLITDSTVCSISFVLAYMLFGAQIVFAVFQKKTIRRIMKELNANSQPEEA